MTKMFTFDADNYADVFANNGYVHIPEGLSEEFHARLVKYVEDSFDKKHLKDFARGDKQQALFEFLEPEHYDELREVVAAICGVEASSLTLSERHIKEYEPGAAPYPLAHKDRFGSEIAVGFSIRVPVGSTLVIYPEHDLSANPFNSTAELRSSFSANAHPEAGLKHALRVEIQDQPRGVQLFRGNMMWHLREHGAGTTVLYLKLNTYNCDTLGEDPHSVEVRQRTLSIVDSSPFEWAASIPVIARRVDYIQRRYNRDWNEVFGVVIYGQPHTTITEAEFEALRLMDGQRTVTEISQRTEQLCKGRDVREAIRLLAQRGIVDLLTKPLAMGQVRHMALREVA
ncbi:hypothetical protein [Edaphobacter bradus]|uniref:hypothetical protein n=1 Tax=Edaphobacter bradus TaxID=2259016 RepID=UPI0021E0ABDD|nr:hypothetical protein [Edaphobacter bradus]